MSRTVLVLAATGTTGREVVSALLSRGATVRAATRSPEAASLPVGAEVVAFDLDDPATWAPALQGVEALYFALPPFRPDEVEVGAAVLRAARAAGVRRVVKLSAMGVEHQPESGHYRLEQTVAALGFAWVHLRPTFFMDNFIHFWGQGIAEHGVLQLPAGQGEAGFVAAADIGAVAAEALLGDDSGQVLVLTGPESLDHAQAASTLSAALGRPIQYLDVAPERFAEQLAGFGMPPLGVQTMGWLYASVRAGETGGVTPDVEQTLGREPTDLATWARQHAEAWLGPASR